ncbi:cellular nucleic acid-binding protein, partial [Trifolium medium]|nr:cellular nucleic acid-binding protein [Trifolium medium]
HKIAECLQKEDKCFRCGRLGHKADVCREKVVCFNCGEEGHKSPKCKKPKRMIGKVFALVEKEQIRWTISLEVRVSSITLL